MDRGQLVDTQTELFTIADLRRLLVETDVDEIYSSRIRAGLKVLLRPAGDSVPQDGTVTFAAPAVDPSTGGRAVKIAFDNPVDLPVGLTVNANIIVSQTEAALSLPRSAIVSEGMQNYVLVLENGIVAQRSIDFSDWPAERVVVTDGLAAGNVVILHPTAVTLVAAVKAAGLLETLSGPGPFTVLAPVPSPFWPR
jgi:multidrug efflux pump subunit AcrA (membrane-fusion protein)